MVVLDTSAVLAVLLRERGADLVISEMHDAEMSIVNVCEVLTRTAEAGGDLDEVAAILHSFEIRVMPFDEPHAIEVAKLRPLTKRCGLGLGDRACLAQAKFSRATALTADKDWAKLDGLGINIRLIR